MNSTSTPIAGTPVTGSGIYGTVQSYGAYIYWALGLIVASAIGYVLYKMNFQIAAVLVFLAAVIALFYYYVKWFQLPSSNGLTWPPMTTPCPDFLTLMNPGSTTGTAQCLDYVGVSANGKLQKADPAKKYNTNDPEYFNIDRSKPTTDQCQNAAQYGLTWSTICPE
jgi:hypothetical protein